MRIYRRTSLYLACVTCEEAQLIVGIKHSCVWGAFTAIRTTTPEDKIQSVVALLLFVLDWDKVESASWRKSNRKGWWLKRPVILTQGILLVLYWTHYILLKHIRLKQNIFSLYNRTTMLVIDLSWSYKTKYSTDFLFLHQTVIKVKRKKALFFLQINNKICQISISSEQ